MHFSEFQVILIKGIWYNSLHSKKTSLNQVLDEYSFYCVRTMAPMCLNNTINEPFVYPKDCNQVFLQKIDYKTARALLLKLNQKKHLWCILKHLQQTWAQRNQILKMLTLEVQVLLRIHWASLTKRLPQNSNTSCYISKRQSNYKCSI